MANRPRRVAQALKEELSRIIHEELKDPRMGFVTVTAVNVTKDLRRVRVSYSVYGDEEAKKKTKQALASASGFIRRLIGERIRLRLVPEIVFELDRTVEYVDTVERLLDKIKREKK